MPDSAPAEHPHIDPVCGMNVLASRAAGSAEHAGTTYYFCSAGCRAKFASGPERWLKKSSATAPPPAPPSAIQPAGIEYTCPMHPEVVQIGPGACPICGMALEPRTATAEEPDNLELREMTRRFWIATALTLPLVLITMAEMFVTMTHASGTVPHRALIELALATPVCTWAAWPGRRLLRGGCRHRHVGSPRPGARTAST
jgi:Cu+-exporting ATPase